MEARSPEVNDFQVRKYRPSDRESVRALCCETGFLGNAIDPVFEDRELFADFLTDYYLRYEPESAFVVTKGDTLHGYILGSRHPGKHQFHSLFQNLVYGSRIVRRYQMRFAWRWTTRCWEQPRILPHGPLRATR